MLNTKPPGERTGYANAECYARTLNDCSQEITREHYISKALLERLGEFTGDGFAWNPQPIQMGRNALRSWILCKRHNNALSPLDAKITELYDLKRRWQDRKNVGNLVLDGEDLERWAIKVMCGLFASGSSRLLDADGAPVDRTTTLPRRYMRILFGEKMPRGRGFAYAHGALGNVRPASARFRVDYAPGEIVPHAIVLEIVGFTWITTLTHSPPEPYLYHPSDFQIGDTGRLTIHWNGARRPAQMRGVQGDLVIKLFEIVEQPEVQQ